MAIVSYDGCPIGFTDVLDNFTWQNGDSFPPYVAGKEDIEAFVITCTSCNMADQVVVHDDRSWGSEWTGPYGGVEAWCRRCEIVQYDITDH